MKTFVGIKGSIKVVDHWAHGLNKHGDKYILASEGITDPIVKKADYFVQTNILKPKFMKKGKIGAYEYIINSGLPYIVLESPAFRAVGTNSGWMRIGWYNYKWTDGIFGNENSPPDRWNKFRKETGIYIKDWKSQGDAILIMGQKEGDSSLYELYKQGYKSFWEYIKEKIVEIKRYTDRPIIIRPHLRSRAQSVRRINGMLKSLRMDFNIDTSNITISENYNGERNNGGVPLQEDFKKAYCVITYNSLSAVEAVCAGIPTFALENGSMAWPVAHKDLSQIEKLDYNIDVTQWCYDVSYTQWHLHEVAHGHAWAHLKDLV